MSLERKRQAIIDFVVGLDSLRDEIKADTAEMVAACPLEILGDADALEEFMVEMMETALERHLITPKRKIRPGPAKLIKSYVRAMKA